MLLQLAVIWITYFLISPKSLEAEAQDTVSVQVRREAKPNDNVSKAETEVFQSPALSLIDSNKIVKEDAGEIITSEKKAFGEGEPSSPKSNPEQPRSSSIFSSASLATIGIFDVVDASKPPTPGRGAANMFVKMVKSFEIEKIVKNLEIPYLVHFTRAENLASIIQHGLLPRTVCENEGIAPSVNDHFRWDGRRDASSLSISFPNYRMFYKYRKENPETDWAVLLISPRVLSEKECAFCAHNAADKRISSQDQETLNQPAALTGMFCLGDQNSPRDKYLQKYDPTDPQAEVLVFGAIEPDKIVGIIFSDADTRDDYESCLNGKSIPVEIDSRSILNPSKNLFSTRGYARK